MVSLSVDSFSLHKKYIAINMGCNTSLYYDYSYLQYYKRPVHYYILEHRQYRSYYICWYGYINIWFSIRTRVEIRVSSLRYTCKKTYLANMNSISTKLNHHINQKTTLEHILRDVLNYLLRIYTFFRVKTTTRVVKCLKCTFKLSPAKQKI